MKPTLLLRYLLLLGLALGQTELLAGRFRVSPVQVFLGDGGSSALVTIFNEGDEPVRFQVSATAWAQSESGEILLEPTDDILFFPKLLEIAPGTQKNVRVASSMKAGDLEKTYRLFLDELPKAPIPGRGASVNVVTKMGVPIFITPRSASPRIKTEARVAEGVLRVDVRNDGSSHASLQEVRVRGVDAAGQEVFSSRGDGWYLLAASIRRFEFPVGERCADMDEVIIETAWVTPLNPEPQQTELRIDPVDGACGD